MDVSNYDQHSDRELLLLTAQKMDWVANEFMEFKQRQAEVCRESRTERKNLSKRTDELERTIIGWQNRIAAFSAFISLASFTLWKFIERNMGGHQ